MILSGSWRKNGTKAAREGQALLLVDRDLGDAFDLIFDRVFDGDDLVFVVLDLAERGVEGGGLAGTGRPGDQHHAVGFRDVAAELDQIAGLKPTTSRRELGELLAHRFLIEHTEHGVFAVDGRHDGDAEIDQPGFVAHAETAVLRDAALGDIEFAHDLDARNDGGVPVLRDGRHGVVQHAVDAVLDDHFLIAGLDVDIAGAPFERVEDGGIDQLDDRRDVAVTGREAVDGERFVRIVFVADNVEREAFGDLFENTLRLFGLLEQIGDLGGGGDRDLQLLVKQEAELVDRVQIARIDESDFERSVLRL